QRAHRAPWTRQALDLWPVEGHDAPPASRLAAATHRPEIAGADRRRVPDSEAQRGIMGSDEVAAASRAVALRAADEEGARAPSGAAVGVGGRRYGTLRRPAPAPQADC